MSQEMQNQVIKFHKFVYFAFLSKQDHLQIKIIVMQNIHLIHKLKLQYSTIFHFFQPLYKEIIKNMINGNVTMLPLNYAFFNKGLYCSTVQGYSNDNNKTLSLIIRILNIFYCNIPKIDLNVFTGKYTYMYKEMLLQDQV